MLPYESVHIAAALMEMYSSGVEADSLSVSDVISTSKRIVAEWEERSTPRDVVASPHVRTPEPVGRLLEGWVKGWFVARYRYNDTRVFPEQKEGYDRIQVWNPHFRTHVWPDQEEMPPEDAARYIEEGARLRPSEIFATISKETL